MSTRSSCLVSLAATACRSLVEFCRTGLCLLLWVAGDGAWAQQKATTAGPAKAIVSATMQNVFQLEGDLYSGSAPESEAAFAELAKLGVKTIVSVDGAKPNVELARKFGLRYVHLPIGYDGVPQPRSAEFVKAIREAGGPVYFHCHHGKHRGPAAAAAACIALKEWDADRAEDFLHQAGTGEEYPGLYRDVRKYRPPTPEEQAKIPAQLPETAQTPALVDTMVSIDERFDALKDLQKSGWRDLPGERTPTETATLVWEQLRELQRSPEATEKKPGFREKLDQAEQATAKLRAALTAPDATKAMRDEALKAVGESCVACHKAHRN